MPHLHHGGSLKSGTDIDAAALSNKMYKFFNKCIDILQELGILLTIVQQTVYHLGGQDGGTVYKQILINAKLQIEKGGKKTEMTGRIPLRR
jgi:hypothetical protein